jgi:hypothetical protein
MRNIQSFVTGTFSGLILGDFCPDVPIQYYALEILLEDLSQVQQRGILSREECLKEAPEASFE